MKNCALHSNSLLIAGQTLRKSKFLVFATCSAHHSFQPSPFLIFSFGVIPVMATDGSKRSLVPPPPRSLNVEKFVESRATELEALHSLVANRLNNNFRSKRNKRRRTTGFDNRDANKRFRKRQKTGVVNKANLVAPEKDEKKMPRRIRRRVELRRNPQHGYPTSGDGTKRLRTHVWHAKRFTMTKLWGFYLPLGLQGR